MRLKRLSLALAGALGLVCATAMQATGNWEIAVVQESRVENRVVLGGTVVPARRVTIAAQLPGRVEFLAGAEGDQFDQGAVLVRLNDDELLARRNSALAQMANADAEMRNANVQFTRQLVSPYSTERMPGMGIPSMFDSFFTRPFGDMMGINESGYERHADLYSRGTRMTQARGSFLQAQSQLQEVEAKLKDATGVAPFEGVITDKLVEVGDTVQPGQPLLAYADTSALEIQIEVPSRLMPGIREGVSVPARLDVRDALVLARVVRVFPMADPNRHTVTVKFELPPDAPAAPGMYAEVMINDSNAATQRLPTVPVSALVRRGSLPAVFVVRPDGGRDLRVLRLGDPAGPGHISVLSGVSPGDRVINNPPPGMGSTRNAR